MSIQLDLFAHDPVHGPKKQLHRSGHIEPASVSPTIRQQARELLPTLRMGTSSWSFTGWDGLVYQGSFSQAQLARHGLHAYAQHPLFRTVGIDRTYYAPLPSHVFERYSSMVPHDFRFLSKAHEFCTMARFPSHPRYGSNQGETNALFLDAAYATDEVVAPFISGMGNKAGPLLFQFAPQHAALLGGPQKFADRLHTFLSALPKGPLYAVEVRNASLLSPHYKQALRDTNACHCINVLPNMPMPLIQWNTAVCDTAPALIIRWMLARHMTYDQAKDAYEPFNAIMNPDPRALQSIAHLIRSANAPATYVIVNNKAEGSAPLSICRLAEELLLNDVPF